MNTIQTETVKYADTWAKPEYRQACHSLSLWHNNRNLFPSKFKSSLDIGCGLGLLIDVWNDLSIDAYGVDLVPDDCLHPQLKSAHKVVQSALWSMAFDRRFDFGICTDVMEHIPTEYVARTLQAIYGCCHEVLFKIAHSPSIFHGHTLHLTLQPYEWWLRQMMSVGGVAEYHGTVNRNGNLDSLITWYTGIEPLCTDKHCVVVGSAPNVDMRNVSDPNAIIIAANGAAKTVIDSGRNVDILCTTSHLFRDNPSTDELGSIQSLQNVRAKSVWVDTKNGDIPSSMSTVTDGASNVYRVPSILREHVTSKVVGKPLWVSTGVWAMCLALYSGARKVTTVGITGNCRDHSLQDSEALHIIQSRFPSVEIL